jgi:hypothetical protein
MLNLWLDLTVSRRHATLGAVPEGAWIEDHGSRAGTIAGDRRIRPSRREAVPFGLPIRTGQSTFAVVPPDWLCFAHGGLVLYGPVEEILTSAFARSGAPVLGPLVAFCRERTYAGSTTFRFEIPGFAHPGSIEVPPLAEGSFVEVPAPDLRLRSNRLAMLSEPTTAQLFASTGDETSLLRPLTVLGFWDWPLGPKARPTLAAFVLPDHPAVARLAVRASAGLERTSGVADLDGLHRIGDPAPEVSVLEALYRTMVEDYRVRWLRPEVSEPATGGPQYQTIRPPHMILGSPGPRDISGSCLDLCLLMAGAMENAGLCPVVVLLGGNVEQPDHALAGCFRGKLPGGHPVFGDRARLAGEVANGSLFLVDWTSAAANLGAGPAPFEEARSSAIAWIVNTAWLSAVDIKASRPPIGGVVPLRSEIEPEVARAYAEAEVLAGESAGGFVETLDLLAGLLRAGGEITRDLFTRAGLDIARVIWSLRPGRRARRDRLDEGGLTRNALAVRARAESLARVSGSPSVREQDLLWALLLGRHSSDRLTAICSGVGLDLDRLEALLAETRPCVWTPDTVSPDSEDQPGIGSSIDGPTSTS